MKKLALTLLLLTLICSVVLLPSQVVAQDLTVVQTNAGKVAGTPTADGLIVSFKGIPFAAPPVGDLRWQAPQPVIPWDGVKECTAFGPSPMQGMPVPFSMWSEEFLIPEEPISEDCLYLNIWTSSGAGSEKLPVLVWIYGGGFTSGGSGVPIYDGEALARKGVVFVSINYRVGVFGFVAHPELTRESGNNASGNYGLLDQLAALRWVRENIAAFGGDPSNVTIAGQSAGSMSVNCLVASPLAKGLFNKAIAQSGASFSRSQLSLKQAEENGVELANSMKATSIADLRARPAEELMKARGVRGPIIDGYVLPEQIADIFEKNEQNKVDLLTGWNEDEGLLFGPVKNAADYKQQVNQRYGEQADRFLAFYPASDDAEAAKSQLNVSRDQIFGVQNYAWANMQAKQGKANVFVYRFTRKVPGTGDYAKYGAFHTGEVPYAYGNLLFVNRPWEATDLQLETTMSDYWVNFVRTGDPNGKNLPEWPEYSVGGKKIMLLGDEVNAVSLPDQEALDFLYSSITNDQ